ncbi:MAG: J domain-containing protein [Clostridiales bacterium]|nr:J domain-containing protein [Clostridiales bacterium]
MQEYFKILGLQPNATEEEIENAYQTLKNQYSRDRFLEGELGNEAARNLTKLETAYQEIKASRVNYQENTTDIHTFDEVEELIKKGDITSAQIKLDNINNRSAEWHYLQSVIFYKKNWINDSKKQLEIALNMEPHNNKYINAYTKLKQVIEYNDKQFNNRTTYSEEQASQNRQMGGTDSNGCADFCLTWCCMNAMLNMCCNCR